MAQHRPSKRAGARPDRRPHDRPRGRRDGWRRGAWAPVAAAALLLSACGGADAHDAAASPPGSSVLAITSTSEPTPEPHPVLPVTVTDAKDHTVTVTSVDRIIPLDGDVAEIVFALGLGEHVVATDLSATYPPEADAKPEIGYQRSLSPEPILAFSPTVLVATTSAGPTDVIDQLRATVPLVLVADQDTLEGPAAKIRAVAKALGVPERGEELARATQGQIDAAKALIPAGAQKPRVAALYLRGERVQQIFGPGSGIHAVLTAAGVIDVGELLGVKDNQAITTEALLREQPEIVIVTTTGLESVGGIEKLLAFPSLSRTPVASSRRVLAYEDQYLYGFGPRTGQLLTELVTAIYRP